MAVAQVLSAEIVNFLAEAHVDAGFFRLMTQPRLEEISGSRPRTSRPTASPPARCATSALSTATQRGFFYLNLWQEGLYGENKPLLSCNNAGSVAFIAYLQPPDL